MDVRRMITEVHYDLMIFEILSRRKDASEDLEPYGSKALEIISTYACIPKK